MIELTNKEIIQLDKITRLNLINSIPGFKSANLIGTKSKSGISNLAIFSSVIHLGSNPPLLAFVMRPTLVPRDTYQNIMETGEFTINHIHKQFIEKAHYTSAKFDDKVSEFKKTGLHEQYLNDFYAPFVKESKIKIAMRFVEEHQIEANNTIFVVGEIQSIFLPQEILSKNGDVHLSKVNDVCISGLNNYYEVKHIAAFNYTRAGNFPVNKLKSD
jgi:flavin reductase (DIM6/NTAB) family NADH-FMN oxidoreductase RutF